MNPVGMRVTIIKAANLPIRYQARGRIETDAGSVGFVTHWASSPAAAAKLLEDMLGDMNMRKVAE